jgi:hypothetical protein
MYEFLKEFHSGWAYIAFVLLVACSCKCFNGIALPKKEFYCWG